ncbi:hypothetical protein J6590_085771 [Homalodisca vitripennis]|nr:hypothetical protein J6590_085771 [Homalodisca vitripennis]
MRRGISKPRFQPSGDSTNLSNKYKRSITDLYSSLASTKGAGSEIFMNMLFLEPHVPHTDFDRHLLLEVFNVCCLSDAVFVLHL